MEVAVQLGRKLDSDAFLTSRGKVLRVRMNDSGPSGYFAVAIECERPFELSEPRSA